MTDNEHFTNLVKNINNSSAKKSFKSLDKLSDSSFTYRETNDRQCVEFINFVDKSNIDFVDKSNIDSINESIFNHLGHINKDVLVNLENTTKYKFVLNILYSIDFNEYNLVTNHRELIDDLCCNILIEFDNIYRKMEYKKFVTRKKLRAIIEEKDTTNILFLKIMADFLDINILILNNRIVNIINDIKKRATVVIYCDKDILYNIGALQDYSIIDKIKNNYGKHFKNYLAIHMKTLSKYKLIDLQEICNYYNIDINPNKRLKGDIYSMLVKFFGI